MIHIFVFIYVLTLFIIFAYWFGGKLNNIPSYYMWTKIHETNVKFEFYPIPPEDLDPSITAEIHYFE